MKKMLSEFRAFALKGNVIDLAVAVVIGGAFGKIVSAMVSDVIMPFVGVLVPDGDWRAWTLEIGKLKLALGHLLGEIIDFTIVAFVIFLVVVKLMGAFKKKEATAAVPATKTCPECLETIAIKARKCKFCASVQPETA